MEKIKNLKVNSTYYESDNRQEIENGIKSLYAALEWSLRQVVCENRCSEWEDIFSTLKSIQYNGWFTIEAFSRNDPDFANAINVWREYSSPWDIAENGLAFIKKHLKETI